MKITKIETIVVKMPMLIDNKQFETTTTSLSTTTKVLRSAAEPLRCANLKQSIIDNET